MEWGFFSGQHYQMSGEMVEYEMEDGTVRAVTAVMNTEEGVGYEWPDAVRVGKVRRFVRTIGRDRLGESWENPGRDFWPWGT